MVSKHFWNWQFNWSNKENEATKKYWKLQIKYFKILFSCYFKLNVKLLFIIAQIQNFHSKILFQSCINCSSPHLRILSEHDSKKRWRISNISRSGARGLLGSYSSSSEHASPLVERWKLFFLEIFHLYYPAICILAPSSEESSHCRKVHGATFECQFSYFPLFLIAWKSVNIEEARYAYSLEEVWQCTIRYANCLHNLATLNRKASIHTSQTVKSQSTVIDYKVARLASK